MRAVLFLFTIMLLQSCVSDEASLKRLKNRDPFIQHFGSVTNPLGINTAGNERCFTMAIDRFENFFCAGTTTGNLADTNLNAANTDIFVMKFNRHGSLLWVKQFGASYSGGDSSGSEVCTTSGVDTDGNFYCGGHTTGSFAANIVGAQDTLMIKLSPSGDLLWAAQDNFATVDETCVAVEVTATNRIYCAGVLNDQAFVLEFDRASGSDTSFNIYGNVGTSCLGLTSDKNGNIFCAGTTTLSINSEVIVGPSDGIIWKLTPDLVQISITHYGSSFNWTANAQSFRDITIDSSGYLYIGASTTNSTVADTNVGNTEDILVLKVNSADMSVSWYQQITTVDLNQAGFDTTGNESCRRIELDKNSNAYCTSRTSGNLADTNLFAGTADLFLTKISPSGAHLATIQFGSNAEVQTGGNHSGTEQAYGLVLDSSGNIYLGGYTNGPFAESNSGEDILLARIPGTLSLRGIQSN